MVQLIISISSDLSRYQIQALVTNIGDLSDSDPADEDDQDHWRCRQLLPARLPYRCATPNIHPLTSRHPGVTYREL